VARPANEHPTDAELEVLRILWRDGPSSLGHICEQLREHRNVATTTVATQLSVMLQKKLVKRSKGTRSYIWAAQITQRKATSGLVAKLLDRVFDGSAERLVAHLVQNGQLKPAERNEIRQLLESDDDGGESA
jgi:predicted transcriptional regulator